MAKSMSNICQGVQPFQTKSQPSTDNNNALQQQPHLSRENFIIYSHDSNRPWLRFRWQILKLVWRSFGRGLTNGWWYFGRRRAGSQMLGACNRMWVHVWCGTPGCIHSYIAKGLQKRLGGSWLSPPLIVTQSYWCGILRDKFLLGCIVSWIFQW